MTRCEQLKHGADVSQDVGESGGNNAKNPNENGRQDIFLGDQWCI